MKKLFLFITVAVTALFNTSAASAQGWKWGVGSKCTGGGVEAAPIAVDHAGNIYATGEVFPTSATPWDSLVCNFGADSTKGAGMIVVSTDSNGVYRWAIRADHGQIRSIVTDEADNIYIFGYFAYLLTLGSDTLFTPGSNATFCVKLNSAGHEVWLKKIADSSYSAAIAADKSGHIYTTGFFYGVTATIGSTTLINAGTAFNPNDVDIFLAKMDTSGNVIWAKSIGGDSTEIVADIAVTDSGAVYMGGTYESASFNIGADLITRPATATTPYFFLAKFNANGDAIWSRTMATGPYDFLNNVAIDGAENLYVTGGYMHDMIFGTDTLPTLSSSTVHMYLAKYDKDGISKWAVTVQNDTFAQAWALAPDKCGNVFVAGAALGNIPTTTATYIFNFDTTGALLDTVMLASGGVDAMGLIVDNQQHFLICGDYNIDSFQIGDDTLRLGAGTYQALFVGKYRYRDCDVAAGVSPVNATDNTVSIYPNPATDLLSIQADENIYNTYTITNTIGQLCLRHPFQTRKTEVNIEALPAGVYYVTLQGLSSSLTKMFVKR